MVKMRAVDGRFTSVKTVAATRERFATMMAAKLRETECPRCWVPLNDVDHHAGYCTNCGRKL